MPVRVYFIFLVIVLCIIAGVSSWKNLILPYRLILVQVVIALIFESLGVYLSIILHLSNSWLFNIYMLLELLLLGMSGTYFIDIKYKKLVFSGVVAGTFFWIVNLFQNPFNKLYNWSYIASATVIIGIYLGVLFTVVLFRTKRILSHPLFYLCGSFILYFASVIPLFGLLNYLINDDLPMANKLFYINVSLNVFRYVMIAIAFYLYGRQAKRAHVA